MSRSAERRVASDWMIGRPDGKVTGWLGVGRITGLVDDGLTGLWGRKASHTARALMRRPNGRTSVLR